MKKLAILALCVSSLLTLSASPAAALHFPEKLVYDVDWAGMLGAKAVHEATAQGDQIRFTSTTRSSGWINTFFCVNNSSESVLTRGSGESFGTPQYFRLNNNEGSHHALREARFDPVGHKVEAKDLLKNTEKIQSIGPKTFDTLSCIYFIRSLALVPGQSVYLDIYDCKRLWNTEVKVLRREEIKTPLGRFKTLVVKPLLRAQGAANRSRELTVWVSDDTLRIPVKMTIKVKVGTITAVLVGGSYWPQGRG